MRIVTHTRVSRVLNTTYQQKKRASRMRQLSDVKMLEESLVSYTNMTLV